MSDTHSHETNDLHRHEHGHVHGHGHFDAAKTADRGRAFAVAIALNVAFVIAEVAAGLLSGSMALLADAGHNLSDVLSLVMAWGASVLSRRPPSPRFTYGLKSSSILAALANAALLWAALGAILIETVRRLGDPGPVAGGVVMAVAATGIVINTLSALLFARGRKADLNLRAAFVHLMADAAVSAGVVLAGLLVVLTGSRWIDPVTSLVITGVIAWSSWGLLRESLSMGLLAVPRSIDHDRVARFLSEQPGVSQVHDLHIWPMSTTETALTAHLVMPEGHPGDAFLHELTASLARQFGIDHPTIQIETGDGPEPACALESDQVV